MKMLRLGSFTVKDDSALYLLDLFGRSVFLKKLKMGKGKKISGAWGLKPQSYPSDARSHCGPLGN